jgi:hypothetical protein
MFVFYVFSAKETQINFTKKCPVISQATSLVQALSGNLEAAKDTQVEFLENISDVADHVPV